MKKKKKKGLPAQTSFGGSLDFGSFASSSSSVNSSSLNPNKPTPPPVNPITHGNVIWDVDFINNSTVVSDNELTQGVNAFQKQINQHFLPAWSIGAQLNTVSQSRNNATIYILDESGNAGILGYHDISDTDIPVAFVYAKTSKDSGDSWTITASHELIEMLVDPFANLAAEGQFVGSPAFFAYEACDPIEADGGYEIDGVRVSNFVFPTWFINQNSTRYDYLQTLDAPFTISTGGTLTYFRAVGDWMDVTSNQLIPKRDHQFSRRMRRLRRSKPHHGKFQSQIDHHPHISDTRN